MKIPVHLPPSIVHPLSELDPFQKDWYKRQLDYDRIQSLTKGKGGRVAVIDNGVRYDHEELIGKVPISFDATNEPWLGYADHGTHVAGVMAGNARGLFPELEIGSFKALESTGGGTTSWVNMCIDRADELGYEVLNLSLGSQQGDYKQKKLLRHYLSDPRKFVVCASTSDRDWETKDKFKTS